jgi:hypothetical protein
MTKQTTKIGVARKRCAGKKGSALKSCMRSVMKGGKSRKRRK